MRFRKKASSLGPFPAPNAYMTSPLIDFKLVGFNMISDWNPGYKNIWATSYEGFDTIKSSFVNKMSYIWSIISTGLYCFTRVLIIWVQPIYTKGSSVAESKASIFQAENFYVLFALKSLLLKKIQTSFISKSCEHIKAPNKLLYPSLYLSHSGI